MTMLTLDTGSSLLVAWLTSYLIHSSLLLAAAWLFARWSAGRHLALEERAWKVALLGGLLTASLQIAGFGPAASPAAERRAVAETPGVAAGSIGPRIAAETPPPRIAFSTAATPVATGGVDLSGAGRGLASGREAVDGRVWSRWLGAGWALGATACLAVLALQWICFRRRIADRIAISSGPLLRSLARLARRAKGLEPVCLSESTRLVVPFAKGLRRPEICLPRRALAELPLLHQESILAHELGHLARRDPLWQAAVRVVVALFYFQPLNLVARRRLAEIAELRCDDWAVEATGRRLELARCLTQVAHWITDRPRAMPVPAMAGRPSSLGRRVRRLIETDPSSAVAAMGAAAPRWSLVAAALVLVATAAFAPGAAPPPPVPDAPAAETALPAPAPAVALRSEVAPIGGSAPAPPAPAPSTPALAGPAPPESPPGALPAPPSPSSPPAPESAPDLAPVTAPAPPTAGAPALAGDLPEPPTPPAADGETPEPELAPVAPEASAGTPRPVTAPAPETASETAPAPAITPEPAIAPAPSITTAPVIAPAPSVIPAPALAPAASPRPDGEPAAVPEAAPTVAPDARAPELGEAVVPGASLSTPAAVGSGAVPRRMVLAGAPVAADRPRAEGGDRPAPDDPAVRLEELRRELDALRAGGGPARDQATVRAEIAALEEALEARRLRAAVESRADSEEAIREREREIRREIERAERDRELIERRHRQEAEALRHEARRQAERQEAMNRRQAEREERMAMEEAHRERDRYRLEEAEDERRRAEELAGVETHGRQLEERARLQALELRRKAIALEAERRRDGAQTSLEALEAAIAERRRAAERGAAASAAERERILAEMEARRAEIERRLEELEDETRSSLEAAERRLAEEVERRERERRAREQKERREPPVD